MLHMLSSPIARLGLAILSCIVFIHVWILPSSHQHHKEPQFQLVLSHYNENLFKVQEWVTAVREMPFVKELGSTVTIYTKNKHANLDQIKELLGAAEVIRLPNVGREQGTYMHHINKTYDHIYPYTMFSQAGITGLNDTGNASRPFTDWLDKNLRYKFTNETKFFNLQGGDPLFCVCGHCPTGYFPLLPQLQTLFNNKICDSTDQQPISWLGQFIVAKEKVLGRPRWVYEYIGSLADAPEGHWIHEEKEPAGLKENMGGESVPENPLFGHTVERIWPTLFNCSSELDTGGCMGSWSPMPRKKKTDGEKKTDGKKKDGKLGELSV